MKFFAIFSIRNLQLGREGLPSGLQGESWPPKQTMYPAGSKGDSELGLRRQGRFFPIETLLVTKTISEKRAKLPLLSIDGHKKDPYRLDSHSVIAPPFPGRKTRQRSFLPLALHYVVRCDEYSSSRLRSAPKSPVLLQASAKNSKLVFGREPPLFRLLHHLRGRRNRRL